METAKLLVAAGAPLQLKLGDTLSPVQPKPLNTCSLAMVAPSLISALVTVMLCALAEVAPARLRPSTAHSANFVMFVPSFGRRDVCSAPAADSHSNFRD